VLLNTQDNAFFLAELVRLKILPTGHIYDAQLRPVRDLLRRRMTLVHQRTALMLSFKSLYTRTTGQEMTLSQLKELEIKEAQDLYAHPANQMIAGMQIKHMDQLTESIEKIEKVVMASARELPSYAKLTTLPGVGITEVKVTASIPAPSIAVNPARQIRQLLGPGYASLVQAKLAGEGRLARPSRPRPDRHLRFHRSPAGQSTSQGVRNGERRTMPPHYFRAPACAPSTVIVTSGV